MIYKKLAEKKIFHYNGPIFHPDDFLTPKFEYQIKLNDIVELISVGTPTLYLEVDVIITKMDSPSAFLFAALFKNLTDRQKVNDKFWFLAQRLADDIREYLEVFEDNVKPVISSINYVGNIPTVDELKTYLIDNP
jgi:hypothetical protein